MFIYNIHSVPCGRLNPQYKISVHHVAVSNTTGQVAYTSDVDNESCSDCNGCCGGIASHGQPANTR